MKEDNNNKAKLMTIGIAVLLILLICGICYIVGSVNKKNREDTDSKLQEDIIEYANSAQEQSITVEEITKDAEKAETDVENEESETVIPADTKPEDTIEEEAVQQQEVTAEETTETTDNQQTTAKWQKEVSENLSTVEIDLPRQMSEMRGYWEAGNMEAVKDLAYLPRYRAASQQLKGTTKYYYFGDTDQNKQPNGKGLALYGDNQYYYGEWKNGARSGSGMWIKYYVYDQNAKAKDSIYSLHSYSGTWNNDLPNGDGAEHYDFIDENLEPNVSYNRNFIGNFRNGLYDGEIYITDYYSNGNVKEWTGLAKNGVWQPMGEKDKKGQYPIIVEITNPDNYQWMAEIKNKNQGVDGLISAAK